MAAIRRVVLDVLKPHDPSLAQVTTHLADLDGVDGANATVIEIDEEVENVEIVVEGDALDLEVLTAAIEDLGGSLHSVDQVASGDTIVDERRVRRFR